MQGDAEVGWPSRAGNFRQTRCGRRPPGLAIQSPPDGSVAFYAPSRYTFTTRIGLVLNAGAFHAPDLRSMLTCVEAHRGALSRIHLHRRATMARTGGFIRR